MPRTRKPKGPKRIAYELIAPATPVGRPIYILQRDLVRDFHPELAEARFAIAWNTSWRPDVDGRVPLAKIRKATDLDRELAAFDFIILLRKAFWNDRGITDLQRQAVMDHELAHAAVRCDDRTGEPLRDERRRQVFRLRKHDIEEFDVIVRRYGAYTRDVETFYRALLDHGKEFKACDKCREAGTPGYVEVEGKERTLTRCECYLTWNERRNAAREIEQERQSA